MIKRTFIGAVASLVAVTMLPAAQADAATKAAAKPAAKPAATAPSAGNTAEQHAMAYLRVLIGGLQSDKVPQPVKGALVGCIYENPFSKISEGVDKVIADNPGKISRDNPSEVLSVMAQICGYTPEAAASAAPAAPAPQGR